MKPHPRYRVPDEDGGLLVEPPLARWGELARENARAAGTWDVRLGGLPLPELRRLARTEALSAARGYTAALGIAAREPAGPDALLMVNGHQPSVFHPGVWVKDLLLQRAAGAAGATALDLVVDTDAMGCVSLDAPCRAPRPRRCAAVLAEAGADVCFAAAPVPGPAERARFAAEATALAAGLGLPAAEANVRAFCDALDAAAPLAGDLGQALTGARRRLETTTGSDYLELGVATLARGEAFRRFAAHIALDARRFAGCFNEALARYRAETGTRGHAQPFPDLAIGELVELPFWMLRGASRRPVFARAADGGGAVLIVDGAEVVSLPGDPALAAAVLPVGLSRPVAADDTAASGDVASSGLLVPRGIALTFFVRLAIADLFIHGTGGGRYDQVTDAVMTAYLGIEPPAYVVASATLRLPLAIADAGLSVAGLERRLEGLRHNPDRFLAELPASVLDAAEARSLAAEKRSLVAAIARPDADKKALGARIRAVNERLQALVAPLLADAERELARARTAEEDAAVLRDRTYAYCLWDAASIEGLAGRA